MKCYKILSSLLTLAMVAACSHTPKPIKVSEADGKEAAISQQEAALNESLESHVNVLAPEQYQNAKKYLQEAKDADDKKDAFEAVGISKAYLNEANEQATAFQASIPTVLEAREKAIGAGAGAGGKTKKTDAKLEEFTVDKDAFKEMKGKDKSKLEAEYLGLELGAIKGDKLGTARRTLDEARAKGAATLIPNAYNRAEAEYGEAERVINADRHSEGRISAAVSKAEKSATAALGLVMTAQNVQGQTPEERALMLQEREKALQEADSLNANALEKNMAQGAVLGAVASENSVLKQREREDAIIKKAADEFEDSEAEVYRQGDKLVIRLKQMQFSTGRSDLPAQSMPLLTKVKGVLKELGPGAVVIEGHTDDVGGKEKNQQLSEKRAEAVAKYFEADTGLGKNEFDTEGFGYSKPLASNKTKEGRAQNRRVDIVVTPSHEI